MITTWRAVPGYEGLYEVSDDGQVRGLRAQHGPRSEPRPLRSYDDGKGYLRLTLFKNGQPRAWRAHQLVALAFLGPRPEGSEVRHKDGRRDRNVVSNLEYGSSAQNRSDAVEHGTHNMSRKTHCKRGHEFTKENTRMKTLSSGSVARSCRACENFRARSYRSGEVV